MNISKIC